jgi:hypothetical protein
VLGLIAGSLLYGLTYQQVFPAIQKIANFGNKTLPDLWNVSPALLIGVFVILVLFLFYLIENGLRRKDKLEE